MEGDESLLELLCENLLSNAWKFTRTRERALIELGFERCRGVYFVRDNGVGFDMAYASKLFVAFQRLHTPDQFQGTGVGLATVQRIVRRHGGSIWARGEVNRGAEFCFTLGAGGEGS